MLVVVSIGACQASVPIGKYGPYNDTNMHVIVGAETLTVYRIKGWAFADGSPPALQLEYASPVDISDHEALRQKAVQIWPAFAPYVEAMNLRSAIITATLLQKRSLGDFATTNNKYFGLIVVRDSAGAWHFEDDSVRLPPADWQGGPRVLDVDGRPLPFRAVPRDTIAPR